MRRKVMSHAQLERALPAAASGSVRFIVVEAIPTGDRTQIDVGSDVTAMVADGTMPEGSLRSHVKRSVILPVQTGKIAALAKLDVGKATRDDYRRAFEACGIPVAAGNTSEWFVMARAVVLSFAKAQKRAA